MSHAVARDITVVIPVYNRENELRRCLESIASQTVKPARVIVVDDGSTDNTPRTAPQACPDVVLVRADHRGATAARNTGLAMVETPWTLFFDSDDVMGPRHIETAAGAVSDGVDIVGWGMTHVLLSGKARSFRFRTDDLGWHNIMHGNMSTQRYMARTALFRAAGGWNEDVPIWNDIELGVRLLALKPRIKAIDANNITMLSTADSITGPNVLARTDRFPTTFRHLEASLDGRNHDWLDLKKAILAADIARLDRREGRRLYDTITRKSAAIRFAYHYQRLGGRSTATLLRPFFSK